MEYFKDKELIEKCTILIVDDSAVVRKTLRQILEEEELEVIGEAKNGQEGFKKYKELKPDIVFMDIEMPECNGIESLKLIKNYDPDAKVIMATSIGKLENILETLKIGAKDYITKPFNKLLIIKTLHRVLKRAK